MLLLDELERHVHTSVLVAGMAKAAGADKVDFPDWGKVRRDFDEQLAADPAPAEDDDKATMLQALGLR